MRTIVIALALLVPAFVSADEVDGVKGIDYNLVDTMTPAQCSRSKRCICQSTCRQTTNKGKDQYAFACYATCELLDI